MRSYTVHTSPDLGPDEAAERAAFVKDGFCWPALIIPLIWLIWRRMWLVLALYIVAASVLMAATSPLGNAIGFAVAVLFGLLFASEANNLRRWTLQRKGWTEAGLSVGRSLADAEVQYFCGNAVPAAGAQTRNPVRTVPDVLRATATIAPAGRYTAPASAIDEPPVTGLFPERET
ncbi:MAG: DUF2628 domain-containing protein [Alphaproteobacteria bacterium]